MSSVTVVQALSLDSTFGCFFISGFLTMALWGIGTLQVYLYYDKYWNTDSWRLRLNVLTVWALDTAQQVVILNALYAVFVKEFGNIFNLNHFDKTIPTIAIITAFIDTLVQILFVMRVWLLSKQNVLFTGVVAALVLAQFTINIVYFAMIYHFSTYTQLNTVLNVERAMNATIAFTDTVIAGSLVFLLHTIRSGLKTSDSVINRLIAYTVSTGLLTAICAILALVLSLALPNAFYYFIFTSMGPKLYVNSMLASLNSRQSIRNGLHERSKSGISITTGHLRARLADAAETSMHD